jgi:uncharacterized membrane protein
MAKSIVNKNLNATFRQSFYHALLAVLFIEPLPFTLSLYQIIVIKHPLEYLQLLNI